jgi:hypothetical protein
MNVPGSFIIIVIILVTWYYVFTHAHPDLDTETLNTLLAENKFKTGDMILFKAIDNHNAPIIASYYGHVGIVYVYSDDPTRTPYIFEAANPTNLILEPHQNTKGIYLSPLVERVKKYKGYCFYKELDKSVVKDNIKEFEHFIDYCVSNMEYDTNIFASSFRKGALGERLNNKTNCGELVFLSLIKLDLLTMKEYQKNVFHHLRWMCNIENLQNFNYYHTPVKILYDPF